MKFFLATILIFCCNLRLYSQHYTSNQPEENKVMEINVDTLSSLPSLLYYQKAFSLDHDYNYDRSNRLKSLKLKKAELQAATGLICLLSMYGVSFLLVDSDNDLSLLWAIPTGMAVAAGEYYLFSRYIKKIQKNIDIIQSTSIYSFNINKKLKVDAVHFSNKQDFAQHSYGLSLKINL